MDAGVGLPEVVVDVAREEWVVVATAGADAACMLPATGQGGHWLCRLCSGRAATCESTNQSPLARAAGYPVYLRVDKTQ